MFRSVFSATAMAAWRVYFLFVDVSSYRKFYSCFVKRYHCLYFILDAAAVCLVAARCSMHVHTYFEMVTDRRLSVYSLIAATRPICMQFGGYLMEQRFIVWALETVWSKCRWIVITPKLEGFESVESFKRTGPCFAPFKAEQAWSLIFSIWMLAVHIFIGTSL